MAWVLITLLVICIIGYLAHLERKSADNAFDGELYECLRGAITMVIIFAAAVALGCTVLIDSIGYTQVEKRLETNIYSVRADGELSGSFFLGSGSIDSQEYYYFYADAPGDCDRFDSPPKILMKYKVDDVQIVEDSTQSPKYVTYAPVNVSYSIWWVHPLMLFGDREQFLGKVPRQTPNKSIDRYLIVPEDTIVRKFILE